MKKDDCLSRQIDGTGMENYGRYAIQGQTTITEWIDEFSEYSPSYLHMLVHGKPPPPNPLHIIFGFWAEYTK